jgi:hypothetical protein
MLIRVMYQDFRYDYVDTPTLDRLITSRRIRKFLRHSEDKWVDITRDLIRGTGEVTYIGPERRFSHLVPIQS